MQDVLLRALGLYSFPNSLGSVPRGGLIQADNVIINRDNVIEPRRGFKVYGDSFGSSSDRVKQLLNYKDRILRHYNSVLQFQSNVSTTFTTFTTPITETETGLRIKSAESNGNLYLTTSTGVKKISSASATLMSASDISDAGMFKGLDISLSLTTNPGFLLDTYSVAYRVLWGITDANKNLVLGSPSQNTSITNSSGGTSTVDVTISIPEGITTEYFFQIYRTQISATASPGDECQLAYEANPTQAEIDNGVLTVEDIIPENLLGANLYTNPNSGDGILQANEPPPKAKDLALFKNYLFYANTETKYRKNITVLGTSEFDPTGTYFLTISDGTRYNKYVFVDSGIPDPYSFVLSDGNTTSGSNIITSLADTSNVEIGMNVSGSGIPINTVVRSKTGASITLENSQTAADSNATATAVNVKIKFSSPKVLYTTPSGSTDPSIAEYIDEMARALVHSVNVNDNELVYAYYLSGPTDSPGQILFESRTIGGNAFYFNVNSTDISIQFNPSLPISPDFSVIADNEVNPNRVFYSKISQPDAVPIVNYFDVGPKDRRIIRILALRESLFILKEEAIYRVSGQTAPFTVALFDSSTLLTAADTAVVLNNTIFLLTSQGVAQVTDTGVSVMSRSIEGDLVKLNLPSYTTYPTASFGLSYESDRSYYMWTVTNTFDTVATQCFKYNTFTNSWTRYPISKTCGLINTNDDMVYLGPSDLNFIEQERKSFTRIDHADREYDSTLGVGSVNGDVISVSTTTNKEIRDVMVQIQYLTIAQFNRTLMKLDTDIGVNDSNYFSLLEAVPGDDLRDSVTALATKLDADSLGTNTYLSDSNTAGPTNSFIDTQLAYNSIINNLNIDSIVFYTNYKTSSGTIPYESIIVDLNKTQLTITTEFAYPYIAGPITVYHHIDCDVRWAPETISDPSLLKQISEATLITEKTSFSEITLGFASDLDLGFEEITHEGNGIGIFGSGVFGENVFGGDGNNVPFRTLVPRGKQRCRYMHVTFNHGTARENFNIFGLSLTATQISSRAYR